MASRSFCGAGRKEEKGGKEERGKGSLREEGAGIGGRAEGQSRAGNGDSLQHPAKPESIRESAGRCAHLRHVSVHRADREVCLPHLFREPVNLSLRVAENDGLQK